MSKNYASQLSPNLNSNKVLKSIPVDVSTKISNKQVLNNTGGYVFKADDWHYLNRFLILGSESNTYYQTSQKLTLENAKNVSKLLALDGTKVVDTVVQISEEGRAPKNNPALFVLAMAASYGAELPKNDPKYDYSKIVREYAYNALSKVARTSTHLFVFATFCDSLRGWGSGLQKAIARWYNQMPSYKLSLQVCKYVSRSLEGESAWSHRDLLRKVHLIPKDEEHAAIYKYVTQGREERVKEYLDKKSKQKLTKVVGFSQREWNQFKENKNLRYIYGHELAKDAKAVEELLPLIEEYSLVHESIPTELKRNAEVYEYLLPNMPLEAMIRNLGVMTSLGTLSSVGNLFPRDGELKREMNKNVKIVVDKLGNQELLKKSKLHPLVILNALKVYSSGRGLKGSNTWTPVQEIKDALNKAFYDSFKYVESTGKNYLLGVDVSGSMTCGSVSGFESLTPNAGAAAMAMVIANTEKNYHIKGFCSNLVDLPIKASTKLENAMSIAQSMSFGSTNPGALFEWATKNRVDIDVFMVITDNEVNSGKHPIQLLNEYRSKMNKPDAKLVIVAMTATPFTFANEEVDRNVLNVAGFDASAPQIIADFARGNI